jgi:hypothetical protein
MVSKFYTLVESPLTKFWQVLMSRVSHNYKNLYPPLQSTNPHPQDGFLRHTNKGLGLCSIGELFLGCQHAQPFCDIKISTGTGPSFGPSLTTLAQLSSYTLIRGFSDTIHWSNALSLFSALLLSHEHSLCIYIAVSSNGHSGPPQGPAPMGLPRHPGNNNHHTGYP